MAITIGANQAPGIRTTPFLECLEEAGMTKMLVAMMMVMSWAWAKSMDPVLGLDPTLDSFFVCLGAKTEPF